MDRCFPIRLRNSLRAAAACLLAAAGVISVSAAPPERPTGRTNPTDQAAMVYVRPGSFEMGSTTGGVEEKPVHRVTLTRGFWMYRYEVTNAQFRRFVEATGAEPPLSFGNPAFAEPNQPAVGLSWNDAVGYARWAGGRLPTEAEWEYAARGTDGRTYPWGNEPPDPARAIFALDHVTGATRSIGGRERGGSPFGIEDLAGNVPEWCSDWYAPYPSEPQTDPAGPAEGLRKVARGGSWDLDPYAIRCAARNAFTPATKTLGGSALGSERGFRLVVPGSL